jgi:S1-C subfamily serine protease
MDETPSGRTVSIDVIRGGSHQQLNATMGKRDFGEFNRQMADANRRLKEQFSVNPPKLELNWGNFDFTPFSMERHRLGISGETVNGQLAVYFGVKSGSGVLVTEVDPETPAARAGLKAGDVIVSVDENKIEDVGQLASAINGKKDGPVALKVVRDRNETTLNVNLEKRSDSTTLPRRAPVRTLVLNGKQVI